MTPVKGLFDPHKGHDPEVENHCPRLKGSEWFFVCLFRNQTSGALEDEGNLFYHLLLGLY